MGLYSSCAVSLVGEVLNGISIQCWLLICNYPKISNSEILIAEESLTTLPLFIFRLITTKAVCYYIKFLCNLSSPCPIPWFFFLPILVLSREELKQCLTLSPGWHRPCRDSHVSVSRDWDCRWESSHLAYFSGFLFIWFLLWSLLFSAFC